ncbi:MAG: glycoside hydrolase family 32 protein [Gemmatimonadaceae bacterium]|nr:glycoside hydrolase family 32 protein [Chitinophagaceae bacterium]
MKLLAILIPAIILAAGPAKSQEKYRPAFHFSPKEKWMNDPNGMVFHKGVYHLFYQYYPGATVWGPMHWGHATSTDLVRWNREPVALYPDTLGYIFSGSIVVDKDNTAGFGKAGQTPLVAIFTHHQPELEKQMTGKHQYQSLAYSLDDGKSWLKYAGNPVLPNPGIVDFRDPKVMWYAPSKKWIMTLATKDRITFYESPNLKDWTRLSDFGQNLGGHGGVWECPDLFTLDYNGKKIWVLLVSINPGGPNGGSVTQYFLGDFNGKTFTPIDKETRWLDYGPDNYAGVTWSNTGNRKIFLGWMSNWLYGQTVPTEKWRSAMTIPRDLRIKSVNGKLYVASSPVAELARLNHSPVTLKNFIANSDTSLSSILKVKDEKNRIHLSGPAIGGYALVFSNEDGEEVVVSYDETKNKYSIDRSKSGKVNFDPLFTKLAYCPRLATDKAFSLVAIVDKASVEVFADGGLSVMTAIYFPNKPLNKVSIRVKKPIRFSEVKGYAIF